MKNQRKPRFPPFRPGTATQHLAPSRLCGEKYASGWNQISYLLIIKSSNFIY
jgi:hypothetical protein